MNSFHVMLAARALYLAFIVAAGVQSHFDVVVTHLPIFLFSLLLPWFGRNDTRLYALDAYVMLVFSASMIIGNFPALTATYGNIVGIDKPLHIAGGVGAAWCAFLFYERYLKKPWVLAMTTVTVALAVGATWEVFEGMLVLLPPPFSVHHSGLADSLLDLVADTIGGVLFALYVYFR